ncbi:MAG: PilT/PilU family type 4a pilus ATPase [Patescibacteria group bacterium]
MSLGDIFRLAEEKGASDVHLVVGSPPILRIDGDLQSVPKGKDIAATEMEAFVFGLLSKLQKERFLAERELDFAHATESGARFRVNIHWEKEVIGLAARLIPQRIPTMEEVGMPEIVYEMTRMPHGLILLTGPAGSGKSTSLAAMVNLINEERAANIITLEDPIEFLFTPKKSLFRQRQIGMDSLSFANGLRHVLRQDPDCVMVGEMRDLETIATTLTLAETGHLVLATLHTFSASQTIERIIDVFPPHQQGQVRVQLATTLRGVVTQQLLPKTGGGRVAAREVLVNTPAVANLIRDNKVVQLRTVMQTSAKSGMVTLEQDLKRLIREKSVSEKDAATLVGMERLG